VEGIEAEEHLPKLCTILSKNMDRETNETTPNRVNRNKITMLFLHSHSFPTKILGVLQITGRNQSILLTKMIMILPQVNIATLGEENKLGS
jgi:hypothetical protein